MLNNKRRKMLIVILLITFLFSLVPPPYDQQAYAAFIGNDGVLPGGGTLGKGGGMCSATIYRVGLGTEDMTVDNSFTKDDTNDKIFERLNKHFSKRMVNMQNSIMFVPDACYTTNAAIGWYNAASGELVVNKRNTTGLSSSETQARINNHDARVRNLKPTNNSTYANGLFYSSLIVKSPVSSLGDLSTLSKGGWKSVLTSVTDSTNKSKQVWDYIFGDKGQIVTRLKNFIGEDLMNTENLSEEHHQGKLKYLDALITLYALSPAGDQKQFYEKHIESFITKKDTSRYPALFAVDTAVRFSSPAQLQGTFVYIPSIHYVNYMHGATSKTAVTSPDFRPNITGNVTTKKLIEESARQSIEQAASRKRKTDLPEDTDGFTWGYSGVVGDALRTNTSAGTVRWRTSSNTGIMQSIFFTDSDYFGFMVAGGPHNRPSEIDYDCECNQTVSIDKKDIEGKLEGNTVGKKLPLLINMKQADRSKLEDWKMMLDGATNLQIKVRLWRSSVPETPIWSKVSGPTAINGQADTNGGHWDNITEAKLLDYLKNGTQMHYTDDLTSYNVPDDTRIEFKYNASISVRGVTKSGKEFLIQCVADDSRSMYVEGPTPPEPEKGSYSSFPEFWSEIKQGSPGNETFEAMAGTPTTRNLYFATGGSEFIVDIDVEYVPDMTSTRTYRSYFTGGVPSEFKLGDQAPSKTVGGQSVNPHTGGSVTKTWSGSIPWTGTHSASGYHGGGVTNSWDYSAQQAALAEATAWAAEVNATVIDHTAASDGQNRKFNSWGASVQGGPVAGIPGTWKDGQDPVAAVPCSGTPCTGGSPSKPGVNATSTAGTAGSYSYTVTGTVPAKIIDGPSSTYDLPMVEDTWSQEINYDYTKITNLKIWKIDKSHVNGMRDITGTNEIMASIVQGDPTVFYNIAQEGRLPTEASAQGRLRFSLEPDQHDAVVWNEGPRTNKDDGRGNNGLIIGPGQTVRWATGSTYTNNSYSKTPDYHIANSTTKDRDTVEFNKFKERRDSLTEVTAISDFLILQTSIGDQAVMYFDKTSQMVATQLPVEIPKTPFVDQWNNNNLTASNWEKDEINIGSYNGKYLTPNAKYSTSGSARVATKFDTLPAGLNRTPRPSGPMRLVETGIDVIDTIPNGQYITGVSNVFYKSIVNYGSKAPIFNVEVDPLYRDNGVVFGTTYSDDHSKVNDIVIHNPVSAEKAIVFPLPSARDQRTNNSKMLGGNLQQPTIEYERRLKPGYVFTPSPAVYETRTIPNPNYAEAVAPVEAVFNYTGSVQTFTASKDGNYSVELWGAEGGANIIGPGGAGGYVKGNLSLRQGEEIAVYVGGKGEDRKGSADQYNGYNNNGGWNGGGSGSGNAGPGGGGATDIRTASLTALERYNWDFTRGSNHGFYNLTSNGSYAVGVSDMDTWAGSPTVNMRGSNGDYIEIEVRNLSNGWSGEVYFSTEEGGFSESRVERFTMSTNDSSFITYLVPVGNNPSWDNHTISSLRFDLANSSTDRRNYLVRSIKVFSVDSNESNRIAVAGGGGAGTHPDNYGGNTTHLLSTGRGGNGCIGYWGSSSQYPGDNGGGGGGYRGGNGSCSDDGRIGYGGSNFAGSLTNASMENGVRRGNGMVRISIAGTVGVGEPTIEVRELVTPAITEPPDDAYEYVEIINNPSAPVQTELGTFSPGNFINLDYPFSISFPNIGDFYGNGAHGLRYTSDIPGRGYTDDMNTTEWTKSKQVKFHFFATYNGKTYAPDTWIDLEVAKTTFDFYVPLANSEAMSALVEFRAIAINAEYPDGESQKNKVRKINLAADHSAIKAWNIDLVGRIGALVLEDTGDFRFSNLFKQPVTPTSWLIPNVVRRVNSNAQNFIVGDNIDVRGNVVNSRDNYLDTYGLLTHMRQEPLPLPLSPEKNTIPSLRKQPMRLGYNTFADVQTIGNYYDRLQIIPYYYSLNAVTGAITPVDIYMSVNNSYKPINKFGAAVPGWDPTSVYPFIYSLDWNAESGRRNDTETAHTDRIVTDSTLEDNLGNVTSLGKPVGSKYPFGTAQIMNLSERNRTFIGTNRTNGIDRNPNGVIPMEYFGKQGQRWHFTYGLPSSSIAVPKGSPVNQSNIDVIRNNNTVLVVALDIKSVGDTYALQYSKANGSIVLGGRSLSLASIPYPVVTVYSANKSSADDLSSSGTH